MSKRDFSRLKNMSSYDDLIEKASEDNKLTLDRIGPKLSDKNEVELPLMELHSFPDHPFKVTDDEAMQSLADSIRNRGVLHPIIVREDPKGGYQIISGHRRKFACEKAGLKTIPAYIVELDDDEAIILMTDANFYQRERLLPSEKAKAYRMKSDAIKRHQGASKGKHTIEEIGEGSSDSATTIKRFIRISYLSESLLDMVDEGIVGVEHGMQISYIDETHQKMIEDVLRQTQVKMSLEQSKKLRAAYESENLDKALIWEILMYVPVKKRKFVLKEEIIHRYFDKEVSDDEIAGVIEAALEKYFEKEGEL